ncbi:MAG TPA: DUF1127 domain-containing protein [Geminicoccaceae bacterium]|nr:DUF1127 domain-containing protein [Geminicoccaceae bacterium]
MKEQIMSMKQRARGKRSLTARLIGPARRVCGKMIDAMRRRARRRTGARQLAQLDDRLLRDIGLTRSQVHAAAHGLLRLCEPSRASHIGAPPTAAANVIPLKRRAIAVRVDQATAAPLVKRAAHG